MSEVKEHEIILSLLAQAEMSALPMEVGMICNRLLVILQMNPRSLIRVADEPGGHKYKVAVKDCPGGSLAIELAYDEATRQITVCEILYPVKIVTD